MPITPLDIRKKTFSTQFRGLAQKEVKSFLELVAKEMEELRKKRGLLEEEINELSVKLKGYERTEMLLKDTLLTAQKTTDELRSAAREKAKAMSEKAEQDAKGKLQNAQKRADEIIHTARKEADRLKYELVHLETEKSNLLHQLRAIANSFLLMIDKWESQAEKTSYDDKGTNKGKR
ncbi:hypothetical protein CH330_09425 [candidate division WOR-3 bacterium JGI_Cruoil_03_51_56]|uniref:DivIVA domain-containing protein n=1 Tax=candidate division WOR-3 bacterium JGI_Cruoil_03_51_56 TaxID=1973747 RepID=A0A235BPG2_UNCW3|nr:MAG: hypothetical protein CH330_09425 [candidate division WOR-3 bacterium JGI_Cruoil_03_51_56]